MAEAREIIARAKPPGLYRNTETGLLREFRFRGPKRGKWQLIKSAAIRRLANPGKGGGDV
jgi:hypothetical protein